MTGVSYTELWDFSSRLLVVERLLGEIRLIDGTPRDEYRFQFVAAEHDGAFERDKTGTMLAVESGAPENGNREAPSIEQCRRLNTKWTICIRLKPERSDLDNPQEFEIR